MKAWAELVPRVRSNTVAVRVRRNDLGLYFSRYCSRGRLWQRLVKVGKWWSRIFFKFIRIFLK